MLFSAAQVEFLRSLSERFANERRDTSACHSGIQRMRQTRFHEVVENAARDAADAVRLARKLALWKARLAPFFAADPALTVDAAIDAYWRREHPESPPAAGSRASP